LVKAPKVILSDTGLIASLLALNKERLITDRVLAGPLLENFVVMELRKQVAWSRTRPQLFHYRTQTGQEVDVILEDAAGRLIGIEIKASATVGADDFKGLHALADMAGQRFHRGIVLYTGTEPLPFDQRLHALPVQALWRLGSQTA
jgi:predicted AAA+ superfamily ATPase